LVSNITERPTNVYYAAGALFLFSLRAYQRRIYRVDHSAVNFLLFTGASAWASYQWSAFFLSSGNIEAALKNNEKELKH
jgi:hypothetical protein